MANAVAEKYCEFQNAELRRLAAQHPRPLYPRAVEDAVVMNYASGELQPIQQSHHLASLVMILGTLLIIAGIITYNYEEE